MLLSIVKLLEVKSNHSSMARISHAFAFSKSLKTQIYCGAQKDVTEGSGAKYVEILDDYT